MTQISPSYDNKITRSLQTTDATVTDAFTYPMADDSAVLINAKVKAIESDGSDRNIYHIEGLFYRDGGGATQQGATTSITTIESEGSCDCEFATDTNDVVLRVTGVAAETWNWEVTIDAEPVS